MAEDEAKKETRFQWMPVWIYGLVDPRDSRVRYVGRCTYPDQRLAYHVNSGLSTPRIHAWVSELAEAGADPMMVLLYEVPPNEDADRWEAKFIACHSRISGDLLNYHHVVTPDEPRDATQYAWNHPGQYIYESASRLALVRWIDEQLVTKSLVAIAREMGFSIPSLTAWLCGVRRPRDGTAKKIRKATAGRVRVDGWLEKPRPRLVVRAVAEPAQEQSMAV